MNKSTLRRDANSFLTQSKKSEGIALITLVFIIIAILVIAGVIFFIVNNNMNSKKNDETITSRENDSAKDNRNNSNPSQKESENNQEKYVIYINNYKIILGKTKIDDLISNVGLNVTYDNISNYTHSTDPTTHNKRVVKLSDGINTIVIESKEDNTDIIKKLSTHANGKTTDPDFDFSTGTKITFVDNKFGKNISIGDYFTEDEYYDCYKITGTAYQSDKTIYVSQTKYMGNDRFAYYLDDNYRIVNMGANLDYMN